MKRMANALAFAVVVLAVFAMEARSTWPQYSPSQLLAGYVQRMHLQDTVKGDELPTLAQLGELPALPDSPRIDEAKLERAMERAQAARERMVRMEMRQMAERVNGKIKRAGCKVVKLDQ